MSDRGTSAPNRVLGAGASFARTLLALVIPAGMLALAGCTPFASSPSSDWHDITPPAPGSMAVYTVSPDVPGLIVGCIGNRAQDLPAGAVTPTPNSPTQPVGPARLWRTRDGGAHWQVLAVPGLQSGCRAVMPPGGNGAIFVIATTDAAGGDQGDQALDQQALFVSHDSGDTWRRVNTTSLGPGIIGAETVLDLTTRGVYRSGVLYSFGNITPAYAPPSDTWSNFLASADDGGTWAYTEHGIDRRFNGYSTIALAADYRAPTAMFRIFLRVGAPQPEGVPSGPLLEHSGDGGRTWQIVGSAEPDGVVPEAHEMLYGALATTPTHPSSLCIASRDQASLKPGSPVPNGGLPYYDLLIRSSDAGVHWNGASFQKDSDGYDGHSPRVAVDEQGDCYTVDYTDNVPGRGPGRITIWRLHPGPQATPSPVAIVDGQIFVHATIFKATSDGEIRLLLIATTTQVSAPHIFWKAAPA